MKSWRALRDEFGDERRTEILTDHLDLTLEDLITEEDVVVTLSHAGYAKSQPLSDYRAQRRGGRGKSAADVKEEDFIDKLFIASTHDTILCFSSRGKVYWLKVYELPQASRSRGASRSSTCCRWRRMSASMRSCRCATSRRPLCIHGNGHGYREEDRAVEFLAAACQRHYRH